VDVEVDAATLEPIVRRALGRPVALEAWRSVPFSYQVTNPLSAGIFRISGTARYAGETLEWSVIVKVALSDYDILLARFPAEDRPELERAYLWDREVLAYESGVFDRLPPGLVAPRALLVDRRADRCWLWLEDLGDAGGAWDVERYALAARHLGRFNGAFPEGAFDAPWLTRGWIDTWLLTGFGSRGRLVLENDAIWDHPLVRSGFASDARERLRRHLDQRERIVQRLNARPSTLCHLDAFRKNLFDHVGPAGEPETAAIDWSYLGYAPIGAEVGHLVIGSVAFADYRQDIRALSGTCLDAYLVGLRDGGWRGDESQVRDGFALSAVRWVFMLGWLTAVLDPARQASTEKWAGQPLAETIAQAGHRTTFLLDLMETALR
jgi:hypothetical protein